MKKNFLLCVLFLFALMTAGCSINPVKQVAFEPIVSTKTVNIFVAIPDTLIADCSIDEPPAIKDYLSANWSNKEAMLSVYVKALLSNLAVCNSKLLNIRKWNQSQRDINATKVGE